MCYNKNMKSRVVFYLITAISFLGFITFLVLNVTLGDFLTPTMIFGTFLYHFAMRLAVGYGVGFIAKTSKIFALEKPYCAFKKEAKLYEKLGIKRWKEKAFTFNKSLFAVSADNLNELIYQMKKAELIHLIIIPLGYLTLLFTLFCSDFFYFWIFLSTAFFTSFIDLQSVVIQRYNLRRIFAIKNKKPLKCG